MRVQARTARLRLTLLYGALFLACGAVLVTITYLLSKHAIDDDHQRISGSSGVPSMVRGVRVHPAEPAPGSRAQADLTAIAHQLAAQRASDLHHLLVNCGIALAIVALLALVLGWLVAGRVLSPLNAIYARLEAAFEAQHQFVANASHELRTPLAWEQMVLQVALADPAASNAELREACEKVLAAGKQQQGLVEGLLTLATSESGLPHREPVDLPALTEKALARPIVEGIEVSARLEPAATVGHPALVERLIANLVDNAARYNVPGGRVRVETATTADRKARLRVTNTGPSIAPADVERLFEPFQRLDGTRANGQAGHGLGLSIVRAIAAAHEAELRARPGRDGGLEIEVDFVAPSVRDAHLDRLDDQHQYGDREISAQRVHADGAGAGPHRSLE